jgi:tetratricopeptide (TPR) repeat protein
LTKLFRFLSTKVVMLATFINVIASSAAVAFDVSKWSYDDLVQTAMEMSAKGNYAGAMEFFDRAVHAAPNNPEAYLNRGAMFEILHESDKAIQDDLHAIELARGNNKNDLEARCSAHQNLAGIYTNNKQLVKAEAEARTAVQLCPDDPDAQEKLADVLMKNAKATEALPYYMKARATYERWGVPKEAAKIDTIILQLKSK